MRKIHIRFSCIRYATVIFVVKLHDHNVLLYLETLTNQHNFTPGECHSCALAESADLQPASSPELRTLPLVTCRPPGSQSLCRVLGSEAGQNQTLKHNHLGRKMAAHSGTMSKVEVQADSI